MIANREMADAILSGDRICQSVRHGSVRMKPSGIICLEGADASGKTMLANHLVTCYGARYLHGRVWYDQVRWYLGMMRRAERLMEVGELVVIDRHWISELVYGPIFRGGAAWSNEMSAEFDARINDAPGVYVLCVPTDAKAHLARFEALKLQRREMFDSIEKVVQRYQDLLHGNIAHPGNKNFMRCLPVAATFTAMHTNTLIYKFNPWAIEFLKTLSVIIFSIYCSRPYRHWSRLER